MEKNLEKKKIRGISKFVILPGMGCIPARGSNWYGWLADELKKHYPTIPVMLEDMPDPHIARESEWIPFTMEVLKCDENSVIIGHSSGSIAIQRLLEFQKVKAAFLVATYHTDLGDENEALGGYFSRPWEWDKIKENSEVRVQFGSDSVLIKSDHLVPWPEQEFVHEKLETDFYRLPRRGHFMASKLPELLKAIKERIELQN